MEAKGETAERSRQITQRLCAAVLAVFSPLRASAQTDAPSSQFVTFILESTWVSVSSC